MCSIARDGRKRWMEILLCVSARKYKAQKKGLWEARAGGRRLLIIMVVLHGSINANPRHGWRCESRQRDGRLNNAHHVNYTAGVGA